MTSYADKGAKPEVGRYFGFHHITFWVGNAKQAAAYYCMRFGFQHVGYRGLETGHRTVCTHVIRNGSCFFSFQSPITPNNALMAAHQELHGDGVKDVAFEVDDARGIWEQAVKRGAKSVRAPWEEEDEHGNVVMATVATYGETEHTFVQRNGYKGVFLPGYAAYKYPDPLEKVLPTVVLEAVDHCVGNQPDLQMVPVAELCVFCSPTFLYCVVTSKN